MSLYKEWFKKAYTNDGKTNDTLWNDFIPKEQKVYEYILENKLNKVEGTIKELSVKFNMSLEYVLGFIDGLNETQNPRFDLNSLDENSKVCIKIDFEKLYKKMIEYKATHLYNLPQWSNIFTEDELKILYRNQKSSTTFVREKKIERNGPCPCGSGKKYKKCCGAN